MPKCTITICPLYRKNLGGWVKLKVSVNFSLFLFKAFCTKKCWYLTMGFTCLKSYENMLLYLLYVIITTHYYFCHILQKERIFYPHTFDTYDFSMLQSMFSEKVALCIQTITLVLLITIPAAVILVLEPNPCKLSPFTYTNTLILYLICK